HLEAYLAGELEAAAKASVEKAIRDDPRLADWVHDRQASRAAFAFESRRRPFSSLLEEARSSGHAERRSQTWLALFAVAASLALIVAAPFVDFEDGSRTRIKGGLREAHGPMIHAIKKTSVGVSALEHGGTARPGDRIRLMIDDIAGGYLTVLLEEEQSGEVSVLYAPDELGRVAAGPRRLPGSIQLDDVLGRERIYVIMSDHIPMPSTWTEQIADAQLRMGFDHGWLPSGPDRVSTLEYVKVQ
ncbi:MAG: hypothetical protein AAF449_24035, partial [Myxococcota bacterium]